MAERAASVVAKPVHAASSPTSLLQRKCACGTHAMGGGECAECGKKRPAGVQAKPRISEPGDIYEQEADRVADEVLTASTRSKVATASPLIQRSAGRSTGGVMETLPVSVGHTLANSGVALEAALRQDMEQRFGYDFSAVRVHTDTRAEASAWAMNARAYTLGNHIVFGERSFNPASREGRHLLAHELTHVVQQTASRSGGGPVRAVAAPTMPMRAPSALPMGVFQYDRSSFSDRFDAEVDTRNHRVALIMRLAINDAVDGSAQEVKQDRIRKFFASAKEAIEKAWRDTSFVLKSNCAADTYAIHVELSLDYANPHHTITLWSNLGERSNATNWQMGDTEAKVSNSPVLKDEKKPPVKSNIQDATFSQVPVVHEFGHLIGLQHALCSRDDDRCYGVTFEQKNDLMGRGSAITPRDLQPFIDIMKRYGQDNLPKECNVWTVVAA